MTARLKGSAVRWGFGTPVCWSRPCAQAHATFYYGQGDLFAIAAAYAFHIAENQPFIDGNKRAALLTALDFLAQNGVPLNTPSDRLYDAMIGIAEKRLNKAGLAQLFSELARSS